MPGAVETLDALCTAGFGGLYFEKLDDLTCIQVEGNELREMRLAGWRMSEASQKHRVLYKGPLAQVVTETGIRFPRGEAVEVTDAVWRILQEGPAAAQSQLLESAAACCGTP
ncbi:MAG: hypothetical protein K2R98_18320 [Gemmataceae bacterium]|nr:hypothetical protein [Gemmataceae bacterium]